MNILFVKKLIVVPMLMVLVFSCNNIEPEEIVIHETENNGLVPLKVGNYWKYKVDWLKEDGSFSYAGWPYEAKITGQILSSLAQNDRPRYKRVYVNKFGNVDPFEWFYRNEEDGLYLMGGKNTNDSAFVKLLYLKYPVKKGETWLYTDLFFDVYEEKYILDEPIQYTCIDTAAIFDTPLGSFKCIVYYCREEIASDVSAEHDVYSYYAPNIGLVGIVTNSYFKGWNKSFPKTKTYLVETNVKY